MGLLTEAERQEFETACAQYPEIAQARENFELSLEQNLLSDAIAPPSHLKGKIEALLNNGGTAVANDTIRYKEEEVPVRTIGNGWKWLAAASVILLIGTLYWAVNTNNKYQDLQQANNDLEQQLNTSTAELNELKTDAATLQKPGMRMASLQGTAKSPSSFVTIFWDTASKDVYLMVNNLPQPATDKQYQLWALLNGKPVDLGVFDIKQEKLLLRVSKAQAAQAFAITLEPKGGSENPTMDEMYVMGKL